MADLYSRVKKIYQSINTNVRFLSIIFYRALIGRVILKIACSVELVHE